MKKHELENKLTYDFFEREYNQKGKSFNMIAEELGTYANYIRRKAYKVGFKPRTQSEAQKISLKLGRRLHPTKGKHHDKQTKYKIGESRAKAWQKIDKETLTKLSEAAKQRWNSRDIKSRQQFTKIAQDAIRKAAKEGSKLEKFLFSELKKLKYVVEKHKQYIVANDKIHIDLLLPTLGIAIEVDGPSHHKPIWGLNEFQRSQHIDKIKTALLFDKGFSIIRIKYDKSPSKTKCRQILQKVLDCINKIKTKQSNRTIEIEV